MEAEFKERLISLATIWDLPQFPGGGNGLGQVSAGYKRPQQAEQCLLSPAPKQTALTTCRKVVVGPE